MRKEEIRLSKKSLVVGMTFILVAGLFIGFFGHSLMIVPSPSVSEDFAGKNVDDMRTEVLSELDFAIQRAEEAGIYNCCIVPPCQECFLEEGSCDCREQLATSGEVCEECQKGLAEGRGVGG